MFCTFINSFLGFWLKQNFLIMKFGGKSLYLLLPSYIYNTFCKLAYYKHFSIPVSKSSIKDEPITIEHCNFQTEEVFVKKEDISQME